MCLMHGPRKRLQNVLPSTHIRQNWLLKADATNALTTVFAGFAFTTDSLPNIIFLVALVAGLLLVFIRQSPGIARTPACLQPYDDGDDDDEDDGAMMVMVMTDGDDDDDDDDGDDGDDDEDARRSALEPSGGLGPKAYQ